MSATYIKTDGFLLKKTFVLTEIEFQEIGTKPYLLFTPTINEFTSIVFAGLYILNNTIDFNFGSLKRLAIGSKNNAQISYAVSQLGVYNGDNFYNFTFGRFDTTGTYYSGGRYDIRPVIDKEIYLSTTDGVNSLTGDGTVYLEILYYNISR
jgi:hypothetical protein